VASLAVSSSSNILAYAVDFVGRRKYSIYFRDLATGKALDKVIEDVTGNIEWAEDNKTLFYTRQDPDTLRWYQVFRHTLGDDPKNDPLVFQEDDEEFSVVVGKSRSRKFILIGSEQTLSSEWRYVSAADPAAESKLFQAREANHEYQIEHIGDRFFIRTNWNARNFRLMKAAENKTAKDAWVEVIPHDEKALLDDFALFDDFLAVAHRSEGLVKIRCKSWRENGEKQVAFSEPVYVASISATPETKTDWLRYQFASLNTPDSVREFNVKTGETRVIKQEEVLGGFNSADYETQRLWATADDGTKIPVSLVRKKTTPLDGTAPCLLYGYGSYGISMDADFQLSLLNLLNRGFVYAIAHIRGGQEMGRSWYEDGKLLKKKNTFTDFINVGEFLVREKIADPRRLYAEGGSAGGLLMGAVMNMRPDLFRGIIAEVPFVDVVNTMLDDSIPLTTSEYDEWGNPNEKNYFDYMLSYSPYDNVKSVAYPNVLVTTGLHDSQVQYWEPAKWVAKLRKLKKDKNLLLFKINTDAGHGGASGRFDQYNEVVLRQAFLLKLAQLQSLGSR
jgi:oligopeptidase B